MVVVKRNDFIEIEFTGKIKDSSEVFDTNIKSEIEKSKINVKAKPYIVSVGHGMAIAGLDKDFEGKEVGKEYSVELTPEEAFGKRDPSMVKMIPIKLFLAQKIMPQKGMQLSLDGMAVKVISVSGGRVLVDFNNPLSGKTVVYNYTIKRQLDDIKEKIDSVQEFFLRKKFDFEIKNNEIVFKVEAPVVKFIEMMSKPFEDILGMKVKTETIKTTTNSIPSQKAEEKKE